jgi:hypothetical protein
MPFLATIPGAIIGAGVLGAGASILSSSQASSAAGDAADAQSQSAANATALQQKMYYQNREDMAPWREAGVGALGDLQGGLEQYAGYINDPSSYKQSPGYNWLSQQGMKGIDASASASGKSTAQDAMRFSQGLASQDYGNFMGRYNNLLNRYSGLAGVGQTAADQMGQSGQNYANQAGNNMMAGGNAQAGGMINAANARTGMYSNMSQIGSDAADQYQMMNNLQGYRTGFTSPGGGYSNWKYPTTPITSY